MKKFLALFLTLALSLSAAALADDLLNETGYPIVKEPVTLRMLCATTAEDPNNFPMVQKIEETTGVHIDWICMSADGAEERRALMWASNDLPDVFGPGAVSDSDITTYGPLGLIIPLNDLIDKYCVNFNAFLTEKGILDDVLSKMTYPDGNIYAFVNGGTAYKNNNGGMFYNKTWLGELGLEVPQTPDAFVEALRKIKETDLNGNGKADEIPFSVDPLWGDGLYVGLLNYASFTGAVYGYTIGEDGAVIDNRVLPEFKESVRWLSDLYAEGLVDIELFTQDRTMFFAKAQAEGGTYGFIHGWRIGNVFGEANGLANYDVYTPLENAEGERFFLGDDSGYSVGPRMYITNACEYPEIVARWVDYCYQRDITEQINAGPEGIGVAYNEDGTYRKTVPEGYGTIAEWFTDHHFQGLPMLFPDDNLEYKPEDYGVTAEGQRFKVDDAIEAYMVHNFPNGINPTTEETDTLALYADLDTYIKDSVARWICGQSDVEADWDGYLAQCEKLGLNEVLAVKQAQYDRFLGK